MQYEAMVLGATGNVGRRIVQLLIASELCARAWWWSRAGRPARSRTRR